MGFDLTADNILEMAERIEVNGASFYRKAAELTCDPNARQELLNLAMMEDVHREIFAGMRNELSAREKRGTAYDPENLEGEYIRTFADWNVFDPDANPSEKLTSETSFDEIIRTAIGLEKDSIVFYEGMRKIVPEWLGRDKVDSIIEEEMRHITILSGKLEPRA
jgi:rubrerythrin